MARNSRGIIVVLSDQPISVEAARAAARAAFDRTGGDLTRLPKLDLPGDAVEVYADPSLAQAPVPVAALSCRHPADNACRVGAMAPVSVSL